MHTNLLLLLSAMTSQQAPAADPQALARINYYRQLAGVKPVVADPELARGCSLHAQYLARNIDHHIKQNIPVGTEENMLPGYTDEGYRTARHSFSYIGQPPVPAVEWLAATLFGRTAMLHPDLKRAGIGYTRDKQGRSFSVIDVNRGRGLARPLAYPADQQKDVPLEYLGPDVPDPIPEDRDKKAGFPVTLTFPADHTVKKAAAVLKDGAGKEVAVWFSSPEKPAVAVNFQRNTVCLIARDPLEPKTTYTVEVTAEANGKPFKKTWSFTTGEGGPPAPDPNATPVDRINFYRKTAGLDMVALDPVLSGPCADHAQYLLKNAENPLTRKLGANDEDAKLPGYTVDGQRAARRSLVDSKEPIAAIDTCMGTFFRRIPLFDAELRRVGVGEARGKPLGTVCVLEVTSGRNSDQTVVFPIDKQKDVPLAYGPEWPDPIPMSTDKKAGFPITVAFPEGVLLRDVKARLEDAAGKEVPVWLSTPEQPAVNEEYQRNTVGLIPKAPLRPAAAYKVTLEGRIGATPWMKTWTFTTAKK